MSSLVLDVVRKKQIRWYRRFNSENSFLLLRCSVRMREEITDPEPSRPPSTKKTLWCFFRLDFESCLNFLVPSKVNSSGCFLAYILDSVLKNNNRSGNSVIALFWRWLLFSTILLDSLWNVEDFCTYVSPWALWGFAFKFYIGFDSGKVWSYTERVKS